MSEALSIIFLVGAGIADNLEGWTLALFAMVIVFDIFVGRRNKYALAFNIIQCLGLVAGYFWVISVAQKQDVAAPYAWTFVVGVWFITALLFHICLLVNIFVRRNAQQ
jgi:hypothetical protein